MAQPGLGNTFGRAVLMSGKLSATAPQCQLQMSYYYNGTTASVRAGFYQDESGSSTYSQLFWRTFGMKSTWQTMIVGVGARPEGISFVPIVNFLFTI